MLSEPLSASPAPVKSLPLEHSINAIGEYTQVYAETHQVLSIQQMRHLYNSGYFSQWNKPVLSFGIAEKPRWLAAEFNNTSDKNILRRLIIENSWLDKADIYLLHKDKLIRQMQFGDTLSFDARPIKHRFFVLDHDYLPGKTQLFIRVETPDPMVLPIFFGTQEESSARDVFNGYSYGLLYGIVIALLLYNFILYIRLRLIRYLIYVIYLAMFLTMNMTYTGHNYLLIWPDNPYWQQWMHPLSISLYAMSGITFAFAFLKTRLLYPRLFYISLTGCLLFLFVQWLYFIFDEQSLAVSTAIGFVMFFSIFTFLLAIATMRHRRREVFFFLIATIATLIGASITAMTVWAIVPYHELLYRAIEIGLSIDVILLSIALAEQFRIIQEEKQLAVKLSRQDPLTGLYNRRAFYELTRPVTHNVKRYQQNLSVIILDIDHFKTINDTFGHETGDKVIQKTAETLQTVIRKGDISARWGGEEFTILLPETEMTQATRMAERLRQEIALISLPTETVPVRFTISLGVAQMDESMNSIEELIKLADIRLFQAKEKGRNQVC